MSSDSLMIRFMSLFALVAGLTIIGCGDSYGGRKAITGTITLAGQPIKEGSIRFYPQDGQDTETGCQISNGKFALERKDGLKPGKYLIRVTAGDGKTPADEEAAGPGGGTNIVSVDLIPPDWAESSTQKVEVKADGKTELSLSIPNKREVRKKR